MYIDIPNGSLWFKTELIGTKLKEYNECDFEMPGTSRNKANKERKEAEEMYRNGTLHETVLLPINGSVVVVEEAIKDFIGFFHNFTLLVGKVIQSELLAKGQNGTMFNDRLMNFSEMSNLTGKNVSQFLEMFNITGDLASAINRTILALDGSNSTTLSKLRNNVSTSSLPDPMSIHVDPIAKRSVNESVENISIEEENEGGLEEEEVTEEEEESEEKPKVLKRRRFIVAINKRVILTSTKPSVRCNEGCYINPAIQTLPGKCSRDGIVDVFLDTCGRLKNILVFHCF